MKLLLVHGEGLGNIIEVLPLIRTLECAGHEVDVALSNTSFGFREDIFVGRKVYQPDEDVPERQYCGKVVTIWGHIHGKDVAPGLNYLNDVGRQQMRLDMSEVSVYLGAAKEFGALHERFDCQDMLGFDEPDEKFDVVLANGYNWKMGDLWTAKAWLHYEALAVRLVKAGLSVCSIGMKREHVPGTTDMTGLSLRETLGLLRRARAVVSNDTGFYHCAAALRTPTVVLFTFTSVKKNYDPRFHETATVVARDDVKCRADCHAKMKWKKCSTGFRCRNAAPEDVFKTVQRVMRKSV
jgi:hypothetical protein